MDKFVGLITITLGLMAALAWNGAVQQLCSQLLGEAGGVLAAKFVHAIIVTLIVALYINYERLQDRRVCSGANYHT